MKQNLTNWLTFSNIYTKINKEMNELLLKEYLLLEKEFYALLFLSQAPKQILRLCDLCEMIDLSQSATSRMIVRMEQKGYTSRHICKNDKRGIYIELTQEGQAIFVQAEKTVENMLSEYIGIFTKIKG